MNCFNKQTLRNSYYKVIVIQILTVFFSALIYKFKNLGKTKFNGFNKDFKHLKRDSNCKL